MKINGRTSAKNEDLLVTVARAIGSTLGSVAAKVNPSPRKSRRRPAGGKGTRKRNLVSKGRQRTLPRVSRRHGQAAGVKRGNRKKSAK